MISNPVARHGAPRGGRRAAIREFFYGMTGYEFERHGVEMRATLEDFTVLAKLRAEEE